MKRLRLIALLAALCITSAATAQQVVAHRGYHVADGAVENSLAALRAAQQAGFYAVECDVTMTSDGEVIVANGPWHGAKGDKDRLNIQRSDLATIRSKRLDNGEQIPTLDEYLDEVAKHTATRLIIEIKEQSTPQNETKLVRAVVDAVKSRKLQGTVDYAAAHEHICNELLRLTPDGTEIVLIGGSLTPEYVAGLGYTAICYQIETYKRIPRWIKEAHRLGLRVYATSVNSAEDIDWLLLNGADYITTDNPTLARKRLGEQ